MYLISAGVKGGGMMQLRRRIMSLMTGRARVGHRL